MHALVLIHKVARKNTRQTAAHEVHLHMLLLLLLLLLHAQRNAVHFFLPFPFFAATPPTIRSSGSDVGNSGGILHVSFLPADFTSKRRHFVHDSNDLQQHQTAGDEN